MALLSTANPFGSLAVRTPPAAPGMRIGVMGGSFNPPHEGHLVVATTALKRLHLDRVWWLVTPGNPLKSHGDLAPLEERLAACRSLARDPRMIVTAFERELGASYTAVTLAFLSRRYPSTTFIWLMGADNLAGFARWQDWRGIARRMPIAVVDRPKWRMKATASRAARALDRTRVAEERASRLGVHSNGWVLLSTRLSETSSTAIRNRTPGRIASPD